MVDTTDPQWAPSGDYHDISYRTSPDGIALVTIERHKRNAFPPLTSAELVHAFVAGYAIGGGYGINLLAGPIGHKRAKEIRFLCRRYDAQQALAWGLVNEVVPVAGLLDASVAMARELLAMSPTALRLLKGAVNAEEDGLSSIGQLARDACLLYYATDEGAEGAAAFMEKRTPDFSGRLAFQ